MIDTAIYLAAADRRSVTQLADLNEYGIGALLVLRRGEPVGIFTERDVLRRVLGQGMRAEATRVRDAMTADFVTVTPSTHTDQAMEMMTRMRFRHMPVVENGRVMGLVSIGDLMRWVLLSQEAEIEQFSHYISGRQPA